jgi:hypothetical protein
MTNALAWKLLQTKLEARFADKPDVVAAARRIVAELAARSEAMVSRRIGNEARQEALARMAMGLGTP